MRRLYKHALRYGKFPASETALDFHYFRRRINFPMPDRFAGKALLSIYHSRRRQWAGRWKLRAYISWRGVRRKCLNFDYRKQPWRLLPGAETRCQRYPAAR